MVPRRGLEPPSLAALDPKSSVSTSFTTGAKFPNSIRSDASPPTVNATIFRVVSLYDAIWTHPRCTSVHVFYQTGWIAALYPAFNAACLTAAEAAPVASHNNHP